MVMLRAVALLGVLCFAQRVDAQFRIGIDPGHGGTEPGAIGPTGLTEKEVNLVTALALQKYLSPHGVLIFMTRTTDSTVSLAARTNYFISNGVQLGISVHHNSGSATSNRTMGFVYCERCFAEAGIEALDVIRRVGASTGITIGPAVAQASELCAGHADWSCPSNGVGQANLHMVREPEGRGIPAFLVEVSFLSNASEETKLRNPDYLDTNGWAIYAGIADRYGVTPIPRNPTPTGGRDGQARIDMMTRAARDNRFGGAQSTTVGVDFNWAVDWELRWMDFSFTRNRSVRMFHATAKADGSLRFVIFWDPDINNWVGWDRP